MLVTIVVCTLNRAERLRRTLQSLCEMRVREGLSWEVIVVNNGCTDHTDAVIDAFRDRLPIRREYEPERGLSRARNRGICSASGDYILWTDDDVVVGTNWLTAYVEAFQRWPGASVFGGPIVPRYVSPVPTWLVENEPFLGATVFARRDFGSMSIPLSIADGRLPYGPNLCIRALEQRVFQFDPLLGHAPGQRRRGEELDVIERIFKAGGTGYWIPEAQVEHWSEPDQQTTRYVALYFATAAETAAFVGKISAEAGRFWFGVPRWLLRRLLRQWVEYRIHRLVSPAQVWLPYLKEYAWTKGIVRYWRGQRELPRLAERGIAAGT